MQYGDYVVKPSSIRDEASLIRFLESNGFRYEEKLENNPLERQYLIVINVIKRIYFRIDMYFISMAPMTEDEFLKRINFHRNGNVLYKSLFSDEGDLLYEGYTLNDKPFGLGTVYFSNGNRYQEGVFDFKGLAEGREYYPSGQLRFEGIWKVNAAYGPNFPVIGNLYDEDGELIFSGKFEVKRGGVGYPMMKYPKYSLEPKGRPKIKYVHNEDL